MAVSVRAKQIGGSIGIIIPKEIVRKENIHSEDILNVNVKKVDDLSPAWGILEGIKKSTDRIMREIDEAEFDD